MARVDVVRDLIPLLGAPRGSETRARLSELLGEPADAVYGDSTYWCFAAAGVDVLFQDGWLVTVFVHGLPPREGAAFSGTFGPGRPALTDRARVRSVLGTPTRAGDPEPIWCDRCDRPDPIGYTAPFDRYEQSDHTLIFEYADDGPRTLKLVVIQPAGFQPRWRSADDD